MLTSTIRNYEIKELTQRVREDDWQYWVCSWAHLTKWAQKKENYIWQLLKNISTSYDRKEALEPGEFAGLQH
jgi:hypothetical protein